MQNAETMKNQTKLTKENEARTQVSAFNTDFVQT